MPLDATVRHMHVLQMANEDLQEELCDKQDSPDRFQEIVDRLPRSLSGDGRQPQRVAWLATALQEEDPTS